MIKRIRSLGRPRNSFIGQIKKDMQELKAIEYLKKWRVTVTNGEDEGQTSL